MTEQRGREVLHIKKYPNRRYYDTTRSRHVTLQELHEIIMSGKDVYITDSRNGEDITNLVLTQILLEKDPPKLDVFPTSIFLSMIRANRHALRSSFDRFFGPFLGVFADSQRQFDAYLRQAMSGNLVTPMDWARGMMGAMQPTRREGDHAAGEAPPEPPPDWNAAENEEPAPPEELDELRRQVSELTRRLGELEGPRSENSRRQE